MKKERQKIPYAVCNYRKLMTENYYYVDKTRYIELLERYEVPVFMRPRRFGKSLLCSTLEFYYDLNRKDDFEALFGRTYIGLHPTGRQNSRMVLSLNFSIVPVAETMAELEKNFGDLIAPSFWGFVETVYKIYFSGFQFSNRLSPTAMLGNILEYVRQNNLPPLYIIIDEYDNFTNQLITMHNDALYEEVTTGDSFLRTFFKVIKAGMGSGAVASCFITGVLPITMDDLTSGFNIAQPVTLQPELTEMLGFTHAEAREYLETVFDQYDFDRELLPEIWRIIVSNYNGYRFLPEAEPIFNSTILTYFINLFALGGGIVPDELIDENLRTDVSWIKRLTLGKENALEMLDKLLVEGAMGYNRVDLKSRFNKEQFFSKDFYPVSLYYLGMTTLEDAYRMKLPNNTLRNIFIGYYNTLHDIGHGADRYVYFFEEFIRTGSLEVLFAGYYKEYLGQFPAQSFDKMNENFVRGAFYELCVRYLSYGYTFTIEQNYPSGRCDWEMTGIPGTKFHGDKRVVEFKYFPSKAAGRVKRLKAPNEKDADQARAYGRDIEADFPKLAVRKYVIYVAANRLYRFWEV